MDCVISESYYKVTILQGNYRKMTIYGQVQIGLAAGPDCGQDQIGLFLKIDLATGTHVSQYHL